MDSPTGSFDVVKILQVGFGGFGFLLAFFTYRIIAAEQRQKPPNDNILVSANRYMAFALAMGVLSICATVVNVLLDRKPLATPAVEPRGTYLVGTVEDRSGPLEGVKVSLVRAPLKRSGASAAANAGSAPSGLPIEVVADTTDKLGQFDLGEVHFGSPDDHCSLHFEAANHRPQFFKLGPSGSLSVTTYMAVSTDPGERL